MFSYFLQGSSLNTKQLEQGVKRVGIRGLISPETFIGSTYKRSSQGSN